MKSHRNVILKGVVARIRQLLDQYEESKIIGHDTTKGSLREAYLKQFLADFVPHPFVITSGFVTDCRGEDISPQIDLLVFDRTSIPGFALSTFVTVLPGEAVRLAIEVKSTLKAAHLAQIKSQQDAIRRLRFAWTSEGRRYLKTVDCLGVRQFVFAFDSPCSHDTLLTWFKKENAIDAICVVGKFIMVRDPNTDEIETIKANDQSFEVLQFMALMHTAILSIDRQLLSAAVHETPIGNAPFYPDFGAYLTFDVPRPPTDPAARAH